MTYNKLEKSTKEGLLDERGNFPDGLEIYVNHESAYTDELAKPVKDGEEIPVTLMFIA